MAPGTPRRRPAPRPLRRRESTARPPPGSRLPPALPSPGPAWGRARRPPARPQPRPQRPPPRRSRAAGPAAPAEGGSAGGRAAAGACRSSRALPRSPRGIWASKFAPSTPLANHPGSQPSAAGGRRGEEGRREGGTDGRGGEAGGGAKLGSRSQSGFPPAHGIAAPPPAFLLLLFLPVGLRQPQLWEPLSGGSRAGGRGEAAQRRGAPPLCLRGRGEHAAPSRAPLSRRDTSPRPPCAELPRTARRPLQPRRRTGTAPPAGPGPARPAVRAEQGSGAGPGRGRGAEPARPQPRGGARCCRLAGRGRRCRGSRPSRAPSAAAGTRESSPGAPGTPRPPPARRAGVTPAELTGGG